MRRACAGDIRAYCLHTVGDRRAMRRCIRRNARRFSRRCRSALRQARDRRLKRQRARFRIDKSPINGVELVDGHFVDQSRANRRVAYLAYLPKAASTPAPVLIASHGLGGSRGVMRYLAGHLAQRGFAVIAIQHPGTDQSVFIGKARSGRAARRLLAKAARNPKNARDRYRDLPFVLDKLQSANRGKGKLSGRLNMAAIGMIGHSFGARSVLVAAGERVGAEALSFKDIRIKAAVALSPVVTRAQEDLAGLYRDIEIPLFHVTGTRDRSPIRKVDPKTRTLPYETLTIGGQYLLVLSGADHRTFSGRRLGRPREKAQDQPHTNVIKAAVALFFQAYLLDDAEAEVLLREHFPQSLAPGDRFEFK